MSQMGDISLVAQVVVFHNTRAFDQLVKKYQSPVRRFFLHQTCGDSELSDDLAQDTFIKAYTNIASFKNLSSFSTWLYRIAYNVFYDYIRSRKETHLHHALLHGRPKHRKDCRYHRMSGGNGKKPPLAGERQNGFLLKTKWL